MNKFAFACKTTLVAASLATVFGTAYAQRDAQPLMLAQAQTQTQAEQGGAYGTSGAGAEMRGEQASGSPGAGSAAAGKAQPGTAKQAAGKVPPVFLLMPVDVAATDNAVKQGCWARVYDRENYSGDMLTVVGPASLANMSGPFGLNWDDRVNSIEVGPKATVTVYDNEAFRDQVAQFKPGQRVADLSKRMGFFDEFASIKVDCQQG